MVYIYTNSSLRIIDRFFSFLIAHNNNKSREMKKVFFKKRTHTSITVSSGRRETG